MDRFHILDLAFLLLTGVLCLFAFRNIPSAAPYLFDEADYMSAGSRGVAANLLERPSMSLVTFIKTGLGMGIDPAKRTNLSETVRSSKDITFLRHYHGPVYFYWLALIGPLLKNNEVGMRGASLVIHFMTFVVIYIASLHLVETGPRIASLVASLLYLFSASGLGTASLVTPHIAYVFFTVLTLVLFARFLQTGSAASLYGAAATLAFAFCSIEYAILLPITFGACLFYFRGRIQVARAVLLRTIFIFIGGLLALWPLGILKLSVIKSYCFIVYLTLMRKGSFGTDSPLMVWAHRFAVSPLEFTLVVACVLAAIFGFRKLTGKHLVLPCLIYGSLMLLTTLKNTSPNWTYIVSILPAFALVAGAVIAFHLEKMKPRPRLAVAILILSVITLDGFRRLPRPADPDPAMPHLLASIRREGMDHGSALVPFDTLPVLSYYFPSMQLHPYLPTDDSASILEKIRTGGYQSFVYTDRRNDDDLLTKVSGAFPGVRQITGTASVSPVVLNN